MATNVSGKITEHISVSEIANNKASEAVKWVITPESIRFLQRVERMRMYFFNKYGIKFNFTSGYRTESFNKSCGGDKNSAHLDGRAADILLPEKYFDEAAIVWRFICDEDGMTGGINFYHNPTRIHITDYEDKFGNKKFVIRDER